MKKINVHVAKEYRETIKRRTIPVKVGDEVKIMRGKYKGKQGKIAKVNHVKGKIYIEGITVKNAKGTEVLVPIHPSNVMLVNAKLDDERKNRLKV